METSNIRPSPIAGLWYEGEPNALSSAVDSFLDHAILPPIPGRVLAVISPHAGHLYSGQVAGTAFASVRGSTPELVVVLSPSHYDYPQPLLTSGHDAYSTPLGTIPVDRDMLNSLDLLLKESLGFGTHPVLADEEHSLEIVLPFLQRTLSREFRLLPIMLREQSPRVSEALGHALAELLKGKESLLVASSDLSHFYDENTACILDAEILRQVEAFSPQGIFQVEQEGKGYACGLGAMAAVLWAAKDLGADQVKVLQHATSGASTGNYQRVVGYGAAVVIRST